MYDFSFIIRRFELIIATHFIIFNVACRVPDQDLLIPLQNHIIEYLKLATNSWYLQGPLPSLSRDAFKQQVPCHAVSELFCGKY